jgi:hypothetical protein
VGNFECGCVDGFELKNGTCRAASRYRDPILIFSVTTEIRAMDLPLISKYYIVSNDRDVVRQSIGVSYDNQASRIYWTDVISKVNSM